jgi:hypothetical protein
MGELLFLASPRKSNQKEGAPAPQECFLRGSLAPLRGALRYSAGAGSAELAFGSDSPRPFPPQPARPAGSTLGVLLGAAQGIQIQNRKEPEPAAVSVSPVFDLSPLDAAEQRRRAGGCRRGLSEPKASSAAARHVEQRRALLWSFIPKERRRGVAFSLATFFWRSKRKYARPSGAEHSASVTLKSIKIPYRSVCYDALKISTVIQRKPNA